MSHGTNRASRPQQENVGNSDHRSISRFGTGNAGFGYFSGPGASSMGMLGLVAGWFGAPP
jgi:hypothetical protein